MAAPVENIIIEGMALNDFGFVAFDTLSGIGLNSFGFLWDGSEIWTDCTFCDDTITTLWTDPFTNTLPNIGTEPVQDIVIDGYELDSFGFISTFNTISGVALNTYGFLFPLSDEWDDCAPCNENITTIWTSSSIFSLPNVGTEPVQDIVIDGDELNSFGFISGFNTISGISLDTFGFLFPLSDGWDECTPCNDSAVTNWVLAGTIFLDTEQNQDIDAENGDALLTEQMNGNN